MVVAGHVDDRHGIASSFETKPQIDTRPVVVQVDIEEDAKGIFEVAMIFESLRSRKQHAGIPKLAQQSPESLQGRDVIINDKNDVPISQCT